MALALAATSVVVLTVAYGTVPWLALVLATTWAAYGYLKKTVPLGSLESLTGETLVLLLPAVVLVVAMERSGEGVASLASPGQVALVLGLGVITATPLLLFAYAAPAGARSPPSGPCSTSCPPSTSSSACSCTARR